MVKEKVGMLALRARTSVAEHSASRSPGRLGPTVPREQYRSCPTSLREANGRARRFRPVSWRGLPMTDFLRSLFRRFPSASQAVQSRLGQDSVVSTFAGGSAGRG